MKCVYCGTPLSGIDYCTGCGADVSLQKRIIRISNRLYNEGLEKASIRDLSGAIVCLRRSLKFNKENIAARNLLGLVYFETGEVVSALCEWVISKNMNVPGNVADIYIDKLQANKNKLDIINQTIRKYNQALVYCHQDNEDMAVIQLKKVLTQNPKLIKGYHLLSLLYLKRQEYEKARKLLKKAARIDATNTTTLRYLSVVEEMTGVGTSLEDKKKRYAKEKVNKLTGTTTYMSGNETIIQPATFRDSSAVATFLNIFLGLLLGGAIVWFLVVPATKQGIYQDANRQITDANSKMSSQAAQVSGLNQEIENYKAQIKEADKTMEDANKKAESYDKILEAANKYLAQDQAGAAQSLSEVDAKSMTGAGKDLYDTLNTALKTYMYNSFKQEADVAYVAGDYAKAIELYQKAAEADPDQEEALYMLGHSYYNSGDKNNSNKIFKELMEKFPGSQRASEVQGYITDSVTGGNGGTAGTGGTGTGTGGTGAGGTGTGDGTTGTGDTGTGAGDTGTGDGMTGTGDAGTAGGDTYGGDGYGGGTTDPNQQGGQEGGTGGEGTNGDAWTDPGYTGGDGGEYTGW